MRYLKFNLSREVKVLFVILTAAFFLRLYHLGFHDFWYDEIATVGYAEYPWGNWNAPLYWILLHFWIKLFGISEFSLRFPSVMFSFLSIVLVFLLGKNLFSRRVGLYACFLIAFSPFHLWYAQEARDYSMVLFLGLLSSYLFYKALKVKRSRSWFGFILFSIMGLYTNYFFIFLLITQALYVIVFLKRLRLSAKHVIGFLIVGLCFLPYLSRFLSKFFYIWGYFWIPEPGINSLVITIENFILGYNATVTLYIFANILAVILFILAVSKLRDKELRPKILLCLFFFLVPVILVFVFSKICFSIYLDSCLPGIPIETYQGNLPNVNSLMTAIPVLKDALWAVLKDALRAEI